MDPPGSLEVTIDKLLSAIASASLGVTNFIRSVRSARTDLVQITRELSDLRLELELLRDEHNVPRRPRMHARAVLDSCGTVLRRIGSLLGDTLAKAEPGRPPRWSVKERMETTNLCNCLQVYREALAILQEMANLSPKDEVPPSARDVDLDEVEEKSSRILEAITDLREAIPQAEPAIGEARVVLEAYLEALSVATESIRNELIHGQADDHIPTELSPPPPFSQQPAARKNNMSPIPRVSSLSRRAPAPDPTAPVNKNPSPNPEAQIRPSTSNGSSPGIPEVGELEAVGPWFPASELSVPFYNNQEQVLLQPRTQTSYHVPRRSPPPLSPFPRAHHSSPPLAPPPKGALPSIPTKASARGQSRHVAELAGDGSGSDVRHVAQYYGASPQSQSQSQLHQPMSRQSPHPGELQQQFQQLYQQQPPQPQQQYQQHHQPQYPQQHNQPHYPQQHLSQQNYQQHQHPHQYQALKAPMYSINETAVDTPVERRHKSPSNHQITPVPHNGKGDYMSAGDIGNRNRSGSDHQWPQPSQQSDSWGTTMYVPGTPTTSDFSDRRTSFVPSSNDSQPSRDTYRSSVSTDPVSTVDSLSPKTSPMALPQPTFEEIRPASPRPPTTRSSGSVSIKNASIRDKLPGVFRASKRKSIQGSMDGSFQMAYRDSLSSNSSSTVEQSRAVSSLNPTESVLARRATRQIEILPVEGLSETKGVAIHHLEISPTRTVVASQHANNMVKMWNVTTGAIEGIVKYSSKVTAGPRTRMYFIRPHVILSEASTLVAVTTSFGNTIEIWNWGKKKRLQMIDHAARWACVPGDVFEANMPPLAIYRSESEKIDLWAVTREPKRPFVHLKTRSINLRQAGLPFVPKFPDLAYSATGPLLVGAAGPRPGAPREEQQCMLLAWQIDSTAETTTSKPYRWLIPDHPELDGALPAALSTYGSSAVSIWHPANYRQIITEQGENKKVPIVVSTRHVLVWDLATNRTRLFTIPNVLSCISPDCRYLAYCDTDIQKFYVLDITSGAEIWSGPDEIDLRQASGSPPGSLQLLGDLRKVTDFRFSEDSGLLFVADEEGGIGIYEIRQTGDGSTNGGGRNASVSTAASPTPTGLPGSNSRYDFGDMRNSLSKVKSGGQ